jgi:hypothetical protein
MWHIVASVYPDSVAYRDPLVPHNSNVAVAFKIIVTTEFGNNLLIKL